MMPITIAEVKTRRELTTYIHLPAKIHCAHSNWLPPIYMDERTYYNPKKNKAFSYSDTILLLAYEDGRPVGRIMGIINHRHNKLHNEKNVRFEHLDCFENQEVAHALLKAIEDWGKEKGMTGSVGPFGFSDKDPQGLMIEGFAETPALVMPCNLQYLPRFVETHGYEKLVDCLDYQIDIHSGIPDFIPRFFGRVAKNTKYRLKEFRKTKEIKPYIISVFHLINKTYEGIYGFVPLDKREMDEMVARYLPLLDARFVKMAFDEQDNLIGFIVGLPNLAKGIQKAKGNLFPFGIFHILRAAKKTKQVDLMLGAIDVAYRGKGIDILMGWRLIESARAAGIQTFETHLVVETNTLMRTEYEKIGGRLFKRFRIYRKDLV